MHQPKAPPLPDASTEPPATRVNPLRLIAVASLILLTLSGATAGSRWLMQQARLDAENRLEHINDSLVQELDTWRRAQLAGVLVLGKQPRQALFPLLDDWSRQEIDGTSWLIDIGGESPHLLAKSGHAEDFGRETVPFDADLGDRPELKATMFMLELTDLDGRHAFGVSTRVPGSNWLVVTTAPVAQLLGPTHRILIMMGLMIASVIVTLIAAMRLLTLHKRGQHYLRRYHREREKRELLEALRESDSQLQVFFNDAFTGMAVATSELRWQRVNPALAELMGTDTETLAGQPCVELFCAEDRDTVAQLLEQLRRGERKGAQRQVRLVHGEGHLLPVRLALHAIRDGAQAFQYLLVQLEDMRDRQEADQLYDALLHTSLDGFWIINQAGELLEVNTGYCRMTGYQREELIGQPITAIEAKEDERLVQARMARMIDGNQEHFETAHRHKDGRLVPIEVSTSYSHLLGGRFYAFLRDISERKRIQTVLDAERAQLRSLFDGIESIIYVADPETYELLYANAAFTGSLPDTPIGKPCYQVMHGRTLPCPFCTNHVIRQRKGTHSHVWQFHQQATGRWYRCADKLVHWSDGRQVRFEIASDITAQKNSDQHSLQLEKLSSLGQLTAGLAHELNNPLMGVINAIQFCLAEDASDAERQDVLKDAEEQTRRCINIVHELLAFSRQHNGPVHAFREVDPQPIIKRVVRLFDYRLNRDQIQFELELDPQLERLRLQPERFEQMVVNLLSNAIDAVAERPQRRIQLHFARRGEVAALDLIDTGVGLTETLQRRVFEPFFTTKPPGKGTGLGLSTSWSIIADHGGTLEFVSAEGQGTRVTARLPCPP
ncbi:MULTISPECIES: PAS domain S-box protein [Thiorhodovibrio]|uniref:PAS domain S-box protein n=1 Tax=Thiorhodovibrio TaxID=61593 RepID=UPI001913F711|nr:MULTISPECIES: PAS domain S-box protein [Thiorhodovibrio]